MTESPCLVLRPRRGGACLACTPLSARGGRGVDKPARRHALTRAVRPVCVLCPSMLHPGFPLAPETTQAWCGVPPRAWSLTWALYWRASGQRSCLKRCWALSGSTTWTAARQSASTPHTSCPCCRARCSSTSLRRWLQQRLLPQARVRAATWQRQTAARSPRRKRRLVLVWAVDSSTSSAVCAVLRVPHLLCLLPQQLPTAQPCSSSSRRKHVRLQRRATVLLCWNPAGR